MSIKQVADAIVKAVGFEGDYTVSSLYFVSAIAHCTMPLCYHQFDTSRADGQYRKPASNKKLLSLIGSFEFTPFEEGVFCRIIEWSTYVLSVDLNFGRTALQQSVEWFMANYDTARTGKQKAQ